MTAPPGDIDVVIPVRDGADFLAAAIESALAQCGVASVTVVDDGSSDGSAAVAARFAPAVRCLRQEGLGAASARNRGVVAGGAALIAFLDADDIFFPDALAQLRAGLDSAPAAGLVAGRRLGFFDPRFPPAEAARLAAYAGLQRAVVPGTVLIRRPVFAQIGPLDVSLQTGEFADWCIRARDAGIVIAEIEAPVVRRRIHGANKTLTADTLKADYLRLLRRHLHRLPRPAP